MEILRNKLIIYLIVILGFITLVIIRPFRKREIVHIDSQGKNIICFGDSITAGENVGSDERYPSVLSELLERPVINAGVSGDTTQSALARLERDVLTKDPLLVVVILGGNDFLRQRPLEETMGNVRAIIEKIQAEGAMVALGQLGPFTMLSYRDDYQRVAEQQKALLIKGVLKGIFGNPELMSDNVHPNAEGHAKLAQKVYSAITSTLEKNDTMR
ncbi:GDSL-type esterase/lipase family protein [Candidatus Omnitrophota bacterium]